MPGEPRITLVLYVTMVLAAETFVLAATDFIKGLCEMTHDMELVGDDPGIGGVLRYKVCEYSTG